MSVWPLGPRSLDNPTHILLLVLAAMTFPATSRAGGRTASVKLTLVWMDPEELLRFGFQTMAAGVTETFEKAGVEVTWRKDAVAAEDDPLEIVVILRKFPPTDWNLGDHTMGMAFNENKRRPVVFVFFTTVLTTLGIRYDVPRTPTATDTMLLAQALARVVSHEVVHAVVLDAFHAEDGLMQSQLTRTQLRASQLRLSDSSIRSLRAGLAKMMDRSRDGRRDLVVVVHR